LRANRQDVSSKTTSRIRMRREDDNGHSNRGRICANFHSADSKAVYRLFILRAKALRSRMTNMGGSALSAGSATKGQEKRLSICAAKVFKTHDAIRKKGSLSSNSKEKKQPHGIAKRKKLTRAKLK